MTERTKCPHCGEVLTRIRTRVIDELTRTVWMDCRNQECQVVLGMHQQIYETIAPSKKPKASIEEKIG